jgi:hypothetical protein
LPVILATMDGARVINKYRKWLFLHINMNNDCQCKISAYSFIYYLRITVAYKRAL